VGKAEREAQALAWLEKVGLAKKATSSVQILSGGERQRVAFVRAVVWKPRFFLLDEPFSALDAGLRKGLREELVELHRLWPVPMILVTHDEADISALATVRLGFSNSGSSDRREIRRI
jgi:ABC-type nitrate/sulfonate/bicarbonate transport system ATPase subunit